MDRAEQHGVPQLALSPELRPAGYERAASAASTVPSRFSTWHGATVVEARRPIPFVDFTPAPALMVAAT